MNIVITYCSRKKARPDILKLCALERYAGSHIRQAAEFALEHGRPLFFLSGWLGLIPADEPVIYYDYYLEKSHFALVQKVATAIQAYGIADIFYYTEQNDKTKPYDDTLHQAVAYLDAAHTYKCGLHVYVPDSSDHFTM